MPETREIPTKSTLEYDPARGQHIDELVEQIRTAEDPAERARLKEELREFIFGPVNE
jgi:hypothetical protein